jgi:hypothetical protein
MTLLAQSAFLRTITAARVSELQARTDQLRHLTDPTPGRSVTT